MLVLLMLFVCVLVMLMLVVLMLFVCACSVDAGVIDAVGVCACGVCTGVVDAGVIDAVGVCACSVDAGVIDAVGVCTCGVDPGGGIVRVVLMLVEVLWEWCSRRTWSLHILHVWCNVTTRDSVLDAFTHIPELPFVGLQIQGYNETFYIHM